MSAKEAPGEVNNKEVFGSPNIVSSEEDIAPEVDKAAEEQKKRETVDIDGIPIEEKDIKYKAADIRKKGKLNYFVDVEGAEERAKAEAKKKETAKREAEKLANAEKQDAERKKKEAADAAEKKKLEEKKQLEEVNAYIKRQKAEKASKERKEKIADKLEANKKKLKIGGIALVVVLAAAFAVAGIIAYINRDTGGYISDEEEAASAERHIEKIEKDQYFSANTDLDTSDDLRRALNNHDFETVDLLFDSYIEKMDNNTDKAKMYANKANRILQTDTREKDRIMAAALKAYELDPTDISVLQTLKSVYSFYDEAEKAKAISEQLDAAIEKTITPTENDIEIEG